MSSKRFQKLQTEVDRAKVYSLIEAVDLVKKTATTKFDSSVEVHVRLGIDIKKPEQQVRGTVVLPHGSGKTKRIAAFVVGDRAREAKEAGADIVGAEELIQHIKSTEKANFDIAVATPDMMPKLASVAKILGPRGLMPSPKSGTVTPNVGKVVEELKKGRVEFKNDTTGNLHVMVGKASWDAVKLKENVAALMETIQKAKPASAKGTYLKKMVLSSTMGPGIQFTV